MKFKDFLHNDPGKTGAWPIIIGGFYRSGTSLVRRILDSHSRIHCGPEVNFFRDFYGRYFQDPLKGIRFFETVRTLGMDEKTLLEILGKTFVKIHETAAQNLGKKRWADKNPENVLFLEQWESLLRNKFYFIHCVRNPLDVFASLKKTPFPLTIPCELQQRIDLYRNFIEKGLAYEKKNMQRSFCIRYEDLVQNPLAFLQKIAAAVGESYEQKMLNFNSVKHQEGLEDPQIRSTEGFHMNSCGKWKILLSRDEIRAIVRNCRDIFEHFGYLIPDGEQ